MPTPSNINILKIYENSQQAAVESAEENNLLALFPKRNREWHDNENNLAVILVPKFGSHRAGRWLMAKMQKPNYHIKLDEVGSFVWRLCDGSATVAEIGTKLSSHFGDKIEPVHGRLQLFFNHLTKTKAIVWRK